MYLYIATEEVTSQTTYTYFLPNLPKLTSPPARYVCICQVSLHVKKVTFSLITY